MLQGARELQQARHRQRSKRAAVARRELTAARRELTAARRELTGARRKLTAARRELTAARRELTAARRELTAARRELTSARRELTAARRELTAARRELTAATRELTTARRELTAARRELTAATRELTAARRELTAATRELTAARRELTAARRELTAARRELTAARRELTAARRELTAARRELTAARRELTAATRELTAATRELTAATRELTAATRELTAATRELTAATRELTVATRELTAARRELTAATRELTSATRELTAARHELTGARRELTGARRRSATRAHARAPTRGDDGKRGRGDGEEEGSGYDGAGGRGHGGMGGRGDGGWEEGEALAGWEGEDTGIGENGKASLAARYLSYHIPSISKYLRTHPSSRPLHPPPHNRLSAASHRLLPARATLQVTDTLILNPSGQLVRVIGVSADISDIKRKEGEIRALNAALRSTSWSARSSCSATTGAAARNGGAAVCGEHMQRCIKQSLVLERMVAELRDSRSEAESANRLKSRFLVSMSHENRTLMNSVLGMTQLLLSTPLSEEQHCFVEIGHPAADTRCWPSGSEQERGGRAGDRQSESGVTTCFEDSVILLAFGGGSAPPSAPDHPQPPPRLLLRTLPPPDTAHVCAMGQRGESETTMLAHMGYECTVAANSQDAIRGLQAHSFDIVLMDVQEDEGAMGPAAMGDMRRGGTNEGDVGAEWEEVLGDVEAEGKAGSDGHILLL
ncbi:unnamed protein product [Closterium sp. NIES-64]|nr:unnamed protein product [Closterium sp. NIES-64]